MSQRLKALCGYQFDGVMDFMYAVLQAGFDSEFSNSLIMRALWDRHDIVRSQSMNKDVKVYLSAKIQPTMTDDTLAVTLHSKEDPTVQLTIGLCVRKENLAILDDVVVAKVTPPASVVPHTTVKYDTTVIEKSVEWDKAKEVLASNPRFNKSAIAAFDAMAKALKPTDPLTVKHITLTPTQAGVGVTFMIGGKKVLAIAVEYSHPAQAIAA